MGLAAHTEYKQIGLHLAEAFGLIESAGQRGPQAESGAMRPRGESRYSSHNEKMKRLENLKKKQREKAKQHR